MYNIRHNLSAILNAKQHARRSGTKFIFDERNAVKRVFHLAAQMMIDYEYAWTELSMSKLFYDLVFIAASAFIVQLFI